MSGILFRIGLSYLLEAATWIRTCKVIWKAPAGSEPELIKGLLLEIENLSRVSVFHISGVIRPCRAEAGILAEGGPCCIPVRYCRAERSEMPGVVGNGPRARSFGSAHDDREPRQPPLAPVMSRRMKSVNAAVPSITMYTRMTRKDCRASGWFAAACSRCARVRRPEPTLRARSSR